LVEQIGDPSWHAVGANRRPVAPGDQVVVIGLGRFGSAVALELVRLGMEVLAVDNDHRSVQRHASDVTHAVEADATNVDALRQLGLAEIAHAVVGIGSDMESSILATAALDELGVGSIWAKAVSRAHGRILERVGAHHIVFPEHDLGQRVAHLLGGRMMDWFQLDEHFSLAETEAPRELVGRSLGEAGIRARFGVTVVCIKPQGGLFTYASADTVLCEGDVVVVAGETPAVEAFARQA
jgi:trk system potassium uptake protein